MLDRLQSTLIRRFPTRFSEKPAKLLLWFWLKGDLQRVGHQAFAIDAACGGMKNRRFFDVDRYLGFDASERVLVEARALHPSETPLLASLADLPEIVATNGRANIVCCVQTLNTNHNFRTEDTVRAVRDLVQATAPGGTLIVNFGSRGGPLSEIECSVLEIVDPAFRDVRVRRYGALLRSVPFGLVLSPILAGLMWAFPPLRHGFGTRYRKLYLVCTDRQAGAT